MSAKPFEMFKQKIGNSLILLLCLSIILFSCGSPQGKSNSSKTIRIMGVVTGNEEEQLQKALAPFTEETGIKIVYEGTNEFATLLPVRVDSGNAPDIAMFPQPGLMADFAREGKLIPVDTFIDKNELSKDYAKDWIDLGSVDGKIYSIWYRAFVKSLVWYNPASFTAKGYKIPSTWKEMIALSDKIVADGGVPWCLGMENGNATGWVGTDWVEDIILHASGPEVYDRWVTHKIPFSDPQVKAGFEEFGKIVQNPKYVVGGKTGVISTPFGDSPKGLFDKPPSCYLHHQGSFITAFFPKNVVVGKDVDVFPFPIINKEFGDSILVSGEMVAMFKDTPEVRALMKYLATPKPHEILASFGGYLSPHKQVSLNIYPDEVMKRQAEILRNAKVLRFDGSDMMPGAVGTGTFWTGIVDYVGGKDLNSVLKNIDESWPKK
nr:extracellular solute-binding protein [Limnofasciculus baicalensis]